MTLGIELDPGVAPDEAILEGLDEPVADSDGAFHTKPDGRGG
jgi:hypothetical protein